MVYKHIYKSRSTVFYFSFLSFIKFSINVDIFLQVNQKVDNVVYFLTKLL